MYCSTGNERNAPRWVHLRLQLQDGSCKDLPSSTGRRADRTGGGEVCAKVGGELTLEDFPQAGLEVAIHRAEVEGLADDVEVRRDELRVARD